MYSQRNVVLKGAWRPIHLSSFPTASRMVLPKILVLIFERGCLCGRRRPAALGQDELGGCERDPRRLPAPRRLRGAAPAAGLTQGLGYKVPPCDSEYPGYLQGTHQSSTPNAAQRGYLFMNYPP